jgi:hypothetical protein
MTSGSYRLFNYTGTLTNNGIANINGVPTGGSGFTPVIVTVVPGQVNLLVLANNAGPVRNTTMITDTAGGWLGSWVTIMFAPTGRPSLLIRPPSSGTRRRPRA